VQKRDGESKQDCRNSLKDHISDIGLRSLCITYTFHEIEISLDFWVLFDQAKSTERKTIVSGKSGSRLSFDYVQDRLLELTKRKHYLPITGSPPYTLIPSTK
jgi:hypothetical protein